MVVVFLTEDVFLRPVVVFTELLAVFGFELLGLGILFHAAFHFHFDLVAEAGTPQAAKYA